MSDQQDNNDWGDEITPNLLSVMSFDELEHLYKTLGLQCALSMGPNGVRHHWLAMLQLENDVYTALGEESERSLSAGLPDGMREYIETMAMADLHYEAVEGFEDR